jgi:hypothetical protein
MFQDRNRVGTIQGMTQPLAQTLEQGDHWIRQAVAYWVERNTSSLREMAAIAHWGLGERVSFSHSIISRIANGKLGISLPPLVCMEALNRAVWLWHTKGAEVACAELGPPSAYKLSDAAIEGTIWLPVPGEEHHPLDLMDLVAVWAGRLELPYLGQRLLLPGEQRNVAEKLPALLDATIVAAGLSPMVGVRQLLAAYPAADEARRERFRSVILGELQLTRDELQDELLAVAEAIRVLRGLPLGSYGPAQLLAELLA